MHISDLENMCTMTEDFFTVGGLAKSDLSLIFFQSMISQVNEIDSDRCISMTFIEFLEAIVRAISKASPPPPPTAQQVISPMSNNLESEPNSEQQNVPWNLSLEERRAQPLQNKIENALEILNKIIPAYKVRKIMKDE